MIKIHILLCVGGLGRLLQQKRSEHYGFVLAKEGFPVVVVS